MSRSRLRLRIAIASALTLAGTVGCTVIAELGDAPIVIPADARAPEGDGRVPAEAGVPADAGPTSCLDILNAQPLAPSGVYALTVDGASVLAYCDMTLGDGGWTAFFVGRLGSPNVFAHFEDLSDGGGPRDTCPSPATQCLRHTPSTVTTATPFAARCGGDAVEFSVANPELFYFGYGAESNWQPLNAPLALTADTILPYTTRFWTGGYSGANRGWIISANDDEPNSTSHTFASSYDSSDGGWDYCNGVNYNGADASAMPVVMLLYR